MRLANGSATDSPIEKVESVWKVQTAADFNSDKKADVLWRNEQSGEVLLWLMNGAAKEAISINTAPISWKIQATGDFNGDGSRDLLWREEATGSNAVWLLKNGRGLNYAFLPATPGSNLQVQAIKDYNQDGKDDIVWRNSLSNESTLWLMNGAEVISMSLLASGDSAATLTVGEEIVLQASAAQLTTVSKLTFGGKEGGTGTFQIQLSQAPTANTTLTFTTGSFLTVDADNTAQNGTQTTIVFTPQDWNQPRTVSFIAELDGSSTNRITGNTVSYSLSGGAVGNGTYDLGTVANTYAPDLTRFNIDLDFRNDYSGFWTPARRTVAQQAANDWATAIANEWTDFSFSDATIGRLETYPGRSVSFTTDRWVDDVVVFVNNYLGSSGNEPALGGPDYEFGGWLPSTSGTYGVMPRVGQVALNPTVYSQYNNTVLYQAVLHEIGHVLGLLGLNWTGYSLQDRSSPQTAVFKGEYSKAANGGVYVPLQSQDGGDYAHPAASVRSVMSYSGIYTLVGPTQVDYAMLADTGYKVYGVNAPAKA
ncbi:hypothetical protein H6F43_14995 [Leptolyngbya sp. FACHB-36]|uniref:FG-GAP-like repeat-containing protein n=1 Tax=Leptolyngbya sp. FACHB-36 TaxID=2692808 RepID=UPI001680FDF8|nr:hypothetical protein [Leptolyngbya sp. FACHB-36]